MAGNVAEWCLDEFSDRYYLDSPGEDPRGPDRGDGKAVRGSHYEQVPQRFWRRDRSAENNSLSTIGCRCAWSPTASTTPSGG